MWLKVHKISLIDYLQQTSDFGLSVWNMSQSGSFLCVAESTDNIAKRQQSTVNVNGLW